MAIYVPEQATQESAIFMPLKTGAYREVNVLTPGEVTTENVNLPSTGTDGSGASRAAALALSRGIVVVSPSARGRNNTVVIDGVTTEVGNGPAALVDLKAAVRYLKHNDEVMLGNAERIVISGTSGGGAMSTLVGATGNSSTFRRYLTEIGAADASDSVFAVAPFCPITDLDNANIAYEYYFYGSGVALVHMGGARSLEPVTLSAEGQRLSDQMASLFPKYIDSLQLKDPRSGKELKLNFNGSMVNTGGSYKDYLINVIGAGATKFFEDSGYVSGDGSLNAEGQAYLTKPAFINGVKPEFAPSDYISWNKSKRKAVLTNWTKYVRAVNRLKPVGAFDNGFFSVTGEMDLFNTTPTALDNEVTIPTGWNHFDYNLGTAVRSAGLDEVVGYRSINGFEVTETVANWAAMLNPMNYIVKYRVVDGLSRNPASEALLDSSIVADHWRIRVGSYDRDSSPFISLNLALALASKGKEVDYEIAWNQPHTGSYDNTEMIDWIARVAQERR